MEQLTTRQGTGILTRELAKRLCVSIKAHTLAHADGRIFTRFEVFYKSTLVYYSINRVDSLQEFREFVGIALDIRGVVDDTEGFTIN